jgi:hypothetical protein
VLPPLLQLPPFLLFLSPLVASSVTFHASRFTPHFSFSTWPGFRLWNAPIGSRREATLNQLRACEAQLLTGRNRLRLDRCAWDASKVRTDTGPMRSLRGMPAYKTVLRRLSMPKMTQAMG